MKRSEQKTEYTWNLESMYADDDLWEKDRMEIGELVEHLAARRGEIRDNIRAVGSVLDESYACERRLEKLLVYARMREDQDTGDQHYLKLSQAAKALAVKAQGASSFIEPEILSHGAEELEDLIRSDARAAYYERVIREIMRRQEHTLSPAIENILADCSAVTDAPSSIFRVFMNADMKFPDAVLPDGTRVPISNSSLVPSLESPDRGKREAVFKTYYARLKEFENTFAAVEAANLKQAKFYAATRGYSSARAMYLSGSNIPESVYDRLIDAVSSALPALHRYMGIRKKVLGVEELHMYDVYAGMFEASGRKYDFETAKQMVLQGLSPMGEEYLSHIREGFESRWIDVYPNEGKRSGAYSWGCYDSQPFVCLNYMETLDNVFTLAHEMGHSVHSWYSNHNQDYAYAGYRIFVAEVASTCNESLLMHDLLGRVTDREERKALLNHYLDSFKGTIFRQTMFAEFEKKMHALIWEDKPVTSDVLNELYLELNRKYYGPGMVSDDEISREWMRIPHFYTPFYVYQYATGYSAAVALSAKILKEGKPAVDAYLSFLKGGSSKDPIDLLKMAGVDMTTPEPVQSALELFAQKVDELEALVNE